MATNSNGEGCARRFYLKYFAVVMISLGPAVSAASVTATLTARENNSLGLKGDWDADGALINRQDCLDDISFTLTIAVSGEDTTGRELYVFAGSSCDTSEDSDDCDDDIMRLSASTTTVKLPVSFIINTDDCADSDTSSIWVGLLDSSDEKDDNADWAAAIDMDFEGGSLSPPKTVSAKGGENKLVMSWEVEEDEDDAEGFLLVYARAEGAADGGVDGGVDDSVCEGPLTEGAAVTAELSFTQITTGSSTSGSITGLQNDVFYQAAVVTLDEYGNPSVLSEVVCEEPGETVDFYELYRSSGGTAGGDYCFVATAAFGDLDHPTVRILRRFRDEVILKLPLGETFVALYYRVGPQLAKSIHSERVYQLLRAGLSVFSGVALVWMDFDHFFAAFCGVFWAAVLLNVLLLLAWRRRADRCG